MPSPRGFFICLVVPRKVEACGFYSRARQGRFMKSQDFPVATEEPDHIGRLESRMSFAAVASDSAFLKMESWAYANGGPRRTAIGVMRYFVSLGWTSDRVDETSLAALAALLPQEPLVPQVIAITIHELRNALRISERELTNRINSGEIRHTSTDRNTKEIMIDLRDFSDRERASILKILGLDMLDE
jgi:hypothetical protein